MAGKQSEVTGPVLCVDIGGTSSKAGTLQPDGQVSDMASIATAPDAESFFQRLTQLIRQTRDKAALSGCEPVQMGLAVAGFLDENRGYLVYNSNLSWLERFPLRQRLQESFPELEIELEVDSNAAAMAEFHSGSGQNSKRFLCLTCGTGLGVGMAISGVPLRFAYGCMGDIGHTVVLKDGPLCSCGGRGCAEVMISATTLARQYADLTGVGTETTLRDVIAAGHSGDPIAINVLERAGEWLGVATASFANTFFPDQIAIAGGLSAANDLVLRPAERVFRDSASALARSGVTFGRASLGSVATLIGAAWPFWKV